MGRDNNWGNVAINSPHPFRLYKGSNEEKQQVRLCHPFGEIGSPEEQHRSVSLGCTGRRKGRLFIPVPTAGGIV